MAYDFSEFKQRAKEIESWFRDELASVHTGRATPALLDNITISAYGTRSPLEHVSSIHIEDPRTLKVTPWDKSYIKEIEKAINDADLGVSVSTDSTGLRVSFPDLTAERREAFKKAVRERLEEARISVKKAREEVWDDIQKKAKEGIVSEDDKFKHKEELQKLVDEANETLEELAEKKQADISS